jgi:hypothetical protein
MRGPKAYQQLKSILIAAISALLLTGCEKIYDYETNTIFMVEHSNYAWGIHHSGIMIDSTGNVMTFNLPTTWNWPDEMGFLSLADIQENLAQMEGISCSVTRNDFAKNSSKLMKAKNGILSDPKNEMYDFGTVQYSGFLYDPDNNRYQRILIRQTGDWSIENSSREAKELYEWLKRPCNPD